VHGLLPDSTRVARSPAPRRGWISLDELQNRRGQTLVASYSVWPIDGAPVSTPLRCAEVKADLDTSWFTIRTLPHRLDRYGDLWAPALGQVIDMEDGMRRVQD
jgi:bifunctional non-homologous end joining protein LigD